MLLKVPLNRPILVARARWPLHCQCCLTAAAESAHGRLAPEQRAWHMYGSLSWGSTSLLL